MFFNPCLEDRWQKCLVDFEQIFCLQFNSIRAKAMIQCSKDMSTIFIDNNRTVRDTWGKTLFNSIHYFEEYARLDCRKDTMTTNEYVRGILDVTEDIWTNLKVVSEPLKLEWRYRCDTINYMKISQIEHNHLLWIKNHRYY